MNVALWILQTLLALHTAAGAVWKYSNSEQSVPSLSAIPHGVWLGLGVVELLCSLALLLPAVMRLPPLTVPLAAGFLTLEMLAFCGAHLLSGEQDHGPMVYWLVVAALSALLVYGRLVVRPH